jgi:putative glutathione S-transferase
VVGAKDLREVYDALTGGYRGRCTAPLLVDKKQKKLVSNESADLMRMLNQVRCACERASERERERGSV